MPWVNIHKEAVSRANVFTATAKEVVEDGVVKYEKWEWVWMQMWSAEERYARYPALAVVTFDELVRIMADELRSSQ